MRFSISFGFCLANVALAAPGIGKRTSPSVVLDSATVIGSTSGGIDSFKGIPYALPPTGPLRLKPPQPLNSSLGTVVATGTPMACPQLISSTDSSSVLLEVLAELLDTPLFQSVISEGEDCLTIDVQRPSTATAESNLPVVFWIFGGAFELGSTSTPTYDGAQLVSTSVAQGTPMIFVAVNYRVGGFGFMPGAEILKDGSANLGLLDQRLALQWTADNIQSFGGNPDQVTIWGESAGAISVFDQMALYNGNYTYKGKPLFRAGIMDSGSIVPAEAVDGPKGQVVYDKVVSEAGCSGATDTLECLRSLDYTTYLNAANSVPGVLSYNSINLAYLPRPDGLVLTDSPETLAANGVFAKIPFIIGDQEDEGTLFALFQTNLSTTADLVDYLSTVLFHDMTVAQIQAVVATYPDDASAGSPFRTSIFYNIYPQFKRLAAMLGDLTFTLTRRHFLSVAAELNPDVPTWSYLNSYDYGTPILGTFHTSDVLNTFGIAPGIPTRLVQSYYINFINTMDPNNGTVAAGGLEWPQWSEANDLLQFVGSGVLLLADNFRQTSYEYISANVALFRI